MQRPFRERLNNSMNHELSEGSVVVHSALKAANDILFNGQATSLLLF